MIRVLTLLLLFIISISTSIQAKDYYTIDVLSDKQDPISQWIFEKEPTLTLINGSTITDSITLEETPQSTQKWHIKKKNTDAFLTATLKNNTIHIAGMIDSQPINRVIPTNDIPWLQMPIFSLQPFILSSQQSITFLVLRLPSGNPILMEAHKESTEVLQINSTSYTAIKVTLHPSSFFKYFWKGSLWFDTTTGFILKTDTIISGKKTGQFLYSTPTQSKPISKKLNK